MRFLALQEAKQIPCAICGETGNMRTIKEVDVPANYMIHKECWRQEVVIKKNYGLDEKLRKKYGAFKDSTPREY